MNSYQLGNSSNKDKMIDCYDEIREYKDGYAAVRKGYKWGLINAEKFQILECIYDWVWDACKTYISVRFKGEKYQIDIRFLPLKYDAICKFENNYAKVLSKGKYGIIDELGCELVTCKYDQIYIKSGIFITENEWRFGAITFSGEEKCSCRYLEYPEFYKNIALVREVDIDGNEKFGCINEEWEEIIPCIYDELKNHGSYYIARYKNKYGCFDIDGKELLECIYEKIKIEDDNLITIYSGKSGVWNKEGSLIIPEKYDFIQNLAKNYFKVITNNQVEFIDFRDELLFNNGVNIHAKVILTDKDATLRSNRYLDKYDDVENTNNAFAIVQKNRKIGLINYEGSEVLACEHNIIKYYQEDFFITKKDRQIKFYLINNNQLIPLEYSFVGPFLGEYSIVSKDFKPEEYKLKDYYYSQDIEDGFTWASWGCINKAGEECIPCIYNEVNYPFGYIFEVRDRFRFRKDNIWFLVNGKNEKIGSGEIGHGSNDNLYGVINDSGIEITVENYPLINDFENGFAAARNYMNKWGYFDSKGNIVVPFIYDFVDRRKEDDSFVVSLNCKYGLVNSIGETRLPCEYDYESLKSLNFQNDLLQVKRDGKYGILNREWNEVVPCIYDGFSIDYAIFKRNKVIVLQYFSTNLSGEKFDIKKGIIDLSSPRELFIPCEYDRINILTNGYFEVKEKNKYGIFDSKGKCLIPCEYDQIEVLDKGYFEAVKNKKYGILNSDGRSLIPCAFDRYNISINTNGFFTIVLSDEMIAKYDAFSLDGQDRIPIIFEELEEIQDTDLVVLKMHSKYGIYKIGVGVIIPCKYEAIDLFSENLAIVGLENKWGCIDRFNNFVIPMQYEGMLKFKDGLSAIKKNGKWGFINLENKIVIPCIYDSTEGFVDGLAAVKMKNRGGFIDSKGRKVVQFDYGVVYSFHEGLAYVSNKYGYGHISKDGCETEDWERYQNYDPDDDPVSSFYDNSYYNDALDMDQQDPEFWDNL